MRIQETGPGYTWRDIPFSSLGKLGKIQLISEHVLFRNVLSSHVLLLKNILHSIKLSLTVLWNPWLNAYFIDFFFLCKHEQRLVRAKMSSTVMVQHSSHKKVPTIQTSPNLLPQLHLCIWLIQPAVKVRGQKHRFLLLHGESIPPAVLLLSHRDIHLPLGGFVFYLHTQTHQKKSLNHLKVVERL